MKKIRHDLIFFSLFWVLSITLPAQNKIIDSLQEVLATAKEDTNKVNILNDLSRGLWRTANTLQGMKYAQEAFLLAEKLHFQTGIVKSYNNIGSHYEYQGNYPEALENHLLALKAAEKLRDNNMIALCYLFIGADYEEQGRTYPDDSVTKGLFSEALKYDLASLKISEETGNRWNTFISYNDIGQVYADQHNYSEALKFFFVALEIAEEIGAKRQIAITSGNIGDAYMMQGDYSRALNYQFISVKTGKEIANNGIVSGAYTSIGTIYFHLKKNAKARQYLELGLSIAKEIGNKEAIVPAYKTMEELDSANGRWVDAYQHHKLFVLYRDSLNNEVNTKKILQTQLQYEFDKKEDSLNQKQLITEINLQTQKKQKSFYLVGAILLASLSFFVFLSFRNQRKVNRFMNISHAKEKAELELHSLRAQLNPHFMFNSLNAIQELILREDFDNSHTYLARFAKLLRMLVENAEKPFVTLNTELEFLELYLSLEKLRIPNLSFSITADPSIDKTKTLIPNMVLQPYIENSLWHGLSQKPGDKNLELIIHKQNGSVVYDVKDNGIGREKAAELKSLYRREHKSKGMELLTKRFKLLNEEFGSEIKTQVNDLLNNGEAEGTLVSINVPNSISENAKNQLQ